MRMGADESAVDFVERGGSNACGEQLCANGE